MLHVDKEVDRYVNEHTSPEDDLLKDIVRVTHLKAMQARMISGHVQGKLLELFSALMQPKRILEIGTFTGYSAICLAKGLAEDGILHTIEVNDEVAELAQEFFAQSKYADKIKLHVGSAIDIVPQLGEVLDLVFIDGDKREYRAYYNNVFKLVRVGGLILADNVLWDGKVVEPVKDNDLFTKELLAFNDMVQNDPRVENVLIPLRDGLMAIRKLAG